MFTTLLLTTLASLALAAPAPSPAPQTLGISLSTDNHCSTITSGTPTSLINGTCYPVPSGFSSMEVYAPPTQGTLTVYAGEECAEGEDTQYFSTEYLGCMDNFARVGRAIKYTAGA